MTRAALAWSENVIWGFSTSGVTGAGSGATALAFTAMTGVRRVTVALTEYEPANTDCVVTTLPGSPPAAPPGSTSVASVISPPSSRTASRAASSLPSGVAGTRTAARPPPESRSVAATCATASVWGSTL